MLRRRWQEITVIANDDPNKEGVHGATLCLGVESEDPGYAEWAAAAGAGSCIPVEIQDNELATPATKVIGGGGGGGGGGSGGAAEEVRLTSGAALVVPSSGMAAPVAVEVAELPPDGLAFATSRGAGGGGAGSLEAQYRVASQFTAILPHGTPCLGCTVSLPLSVSDSDAANVVILRAETESSDTVAAIPGAVVARGAGGKLLASVTVDGFSIYFAAVMRPEVAVVPSSAALASFSECPVCDPVLVDRGLALESNTLYGTALADLRIFKATVSLTLDPTVSTVSGTFGDEISVACNLLEPAESLACAEAVAALGDPAWNMTTMSLALGGGAGASPQPAGLFMAALRGLAYSNPSRNPGAGRRDLALTLVEDHRGAGIPFAGPAATLASFTVTETDDPPDLTTSPGTLLFEEGGAAVRVDPLARLTDPDTRTLAGARAWIVPKVEGERLIMQEVAVPDLTWSSTTVIATDDGIDITPRSGAVTVGDLQTALRAVTFSSSATAHATLEREVYFEVAGADVASARAVKWITIIPRNDPPVLHEGLLQAYETVEDTPFSFKASASDPEGGIVTINVTCNAAKGFVDLSRVECEPWGCDGVDASVGGRGLCTECTSFLQYLPFADENGVDTFIIQAADAEGELSTMQSVDVSILAVNDPPRVQNYTFEATVLVERSGPAVMVRLDSA